MNPAPTKPTWPPNVLPAIPPESSCSTVDQKPSFNTSFIPVISPPTPSPSPRPSKCHCPGRNEPPLLRDVRVAFQQFDTQARNRLLTELLSCCEVETLVHVSNIIAPRIKRDFLKDLPIEIALHIISFIQDPRTLARASAVSRFWRFLLSDEYTWKNMCRTHKFCPDRLGFTSLGCPSPRARVVRRLSVPDPNETNGGVPDTDMNMELDVSDNESDSDIDAGDQLVEPMRALCPSKASSGPCMATDNSKTRETREKKKKTPKPQHFSFRQHFKASYLTEMNWRHGGRVLKSHTSPDDGTVTNVSIDDEWILVSLTNRRVHVFSAETGDLMRNLVGHQQGIWALHLVSKRGKPLLPFTPSTLSSSSSFSPVPSLIGRTPPRERSPLFGVGLRVAPDDRSPPSPSTPPLPSERTPSPLPGDLTQSDVCNASYGWGQEGALAITGSCDRDVRVWDVRSGYCLHVLKGHTSTVRCVKALDGRPIAVSGARDGVIRVWDIQKGICLRVLEGHESSVRALDIAGNVAITGSYDHTARLWNVDTGECMRTFRGHAHQIYSVAFDGKHLATGSLDSTVRLWDAESGECMALLQGHTSLVGNLQILDGDLVTGGSDGRVIIFSLRDFRTVLRICAHDNSVTTMQVDNSYLMTGGNDGCVKLFERETGALVRELTERCDGVWKVVMRKDKCVIMCKRGGRTVIEVLSFGPTPNQI